MGNYLEHGMCFPSQCHFFESFATHIDRKGHSNIIGFNSIYFIRTIYLNLATNYTKTAFFKKGGLTPLKGYSTILDRLAISMAETAASQPLFPAFVPARSMACSIVSVVKTPNMTGIPVFNEMAAMPFAASLQT